MLQSSSVNLLNDRDVPPLGRGDGLRSLVQHHHPPGEVTPQLHPADVASGLGDGLGLEGGHHGQLVTEDPVVSPQIIPEPNFLQLVDQSRGRGLELTQGLLPPAERDKVVLIAQLPGGDGDRTPGQSQHCAGCLGVRVEVELCRLGDVADTLQSRTALGPLD